MVDGHGFDFDLIITLHFEDVGQTCPVGGTVWLLCILLQKYVCAISFHA